MIRSRCCAATSPDGCSTTMLQPPSSRAAAAARARAVDGMIRGWTCRIGYTAGSDLSGTSAVACRHWTFCPIAVRDAHGAQAYADRDIPARPTKPSSTVRHRGRLPPKPHGRRCRHVAARSRRTVAQPPGEIAIGVVIGRTSEFFDFFVYRHRLGAGVPAGWSSRSSTALTGTLYSFAIFALAFIARPIGTVIFMAIDRRCGRGTKLTVALFLLGTSTVGDRLPARLCADRLGTSA